MAEGRQECSEGKRKLEEALSLKKKDTKPAAELKDGHGPQGRWQEASRQKQRGAEMARETEGGLRAQRYWGGDLNRVRGSRGRRRPTGGKRDGGEDKETALRKREEMFLQSQRGTSYASEITACRGDPLTPQDEWREEKKK